MCKTQDLIKRHEKLVLTKSDIDWLNSTHWSHTIDISKWQQINRKRAVDSKGQLNLSARSERPYCFVQCSIVAENSCVKAMIRLIIKKVHSPPRGRRLE